jgi:hypothetical protein
MNAAAEAAFSTCRWGKEWWVCDEDLETALAKKALTFHLGLQMPDGQLKAREKLGFSASILHLPPFLSHSLL